MTAAVEIAVKEINAGGGVDGNPAELVVADDACDANIAARSLDRLLSQGAKAIMGTGCSNVTLALLDKIQSSKVTMCSGANTGRSSRRRRAAATSRDVDLADDAGAGDGPGGPPGRRHQRRHPEPRRSVLRGPAGNTKATLESRGAKIAKYIVYDPAQTGFEAEVAAIVADKPDAIVTVGRDERGPIFRLLIERGYGPSKVGWYTPAGITPEFYKLVDPSNPAVLKGLKQMSPTKASPTASSASGCSPRIRRSRSSSSRPSSMTARSSPRSAATRSRPIHPSTRAASPP